MQTFGGAGIAVSDEIHIFVLWMDALQKRYTYI